MPEAEGRLLGAGSRVLVLGKVSGMDVYRQGFVTPFSLNY